MANTAIRKPNISVSGDFSFAMVAPSHTISSSPAEHDEKALVSGDNTLTVPSGAKCLVIVPPSDNATALTLKGDAGDTGVTIRPDSYTEIGLADTPGVIILNAGAIVTVDLYWF